MKALPTWLGRDSPLLNCMNAAKQLALLVVLLSGPGAWPGEAGNRVN